MTEATLSLPTDSAVTALPGLAERVRGRVLLAGTEAHAEAATPWKLAVPSTHLAAVEVLDAAHVASVLRYFGESGLQVAVPGDRPRRLPHSS